MFPRLKRAWRRLEAFLEEFYARTPGCCCSGGLSVAELNGERPRKGERR